MPWYELSNTLSQSVPGRVTQQALNLADVGPAVAHITGAKVAVHRLSIGVHAVGGQVATQQGKQFVKCGAVAHGHVVDLITRLCVFSGGGQQIDLHYILDIAEVAAGFAVAVNINFFSFQQCGDPFGNDSGVSAFRVLARAEDVEVAQADGVETVAAGKHIGIQLVDVFGHGVGAERLAYGVFDLWQASVVAVGTAAGCVSEALHLGVAGGHQHVHKAGDVGAVGDDGVFKAAGYAA